MNAIQTIIRRLLPALIGLFAAAMPAQAQTSPDPQVISPLQVAADPNNVNVVTGKTTPTVPILSVPGAPNLRFDRVQNAAPYITGRINFSPDQGTHSYRYAVHTGGDTSESFGCPDGTDCQTATGTGSTFQPGVNVYRQAGSGAIWTYNRLHVQTVTPLVGGGTDTFVQYYASSIQYPSGETITYTYYTEQMVGDFIPNRNFYRPTTITSNRGYYIELDYGPGLVGDQPTQWGTVTEARLYATGADHNAPLGRLTYTATTVTDHGNRALSDPGGRVYTCTCQSTLGGNIEMVAGSMQLPGEATPVVQTTTTTQNANASLVGTVTRDGVPYTYTYTNLVPYGTIWKYSAVTVDGPDSYHQVYNISLAGTVTTPFQRVGSVVDSLNRTTSYVYDSANRPTTITYPEGNQEILVYDDYSNVLSRTLRAKPGSGLADIVETAGFQGEGCLKVMCYRPLWTRDALGRQTDYEYDTFTGLVTLRKEPADANGVRRFTYFEYNAGLGRPSAIRVCGDITTCGTNQEIRTEYEYFGGTPLVSVARQVDLAGVTTLVTTNSYDPAGRLLSTDGPLAGSDDATYNRYDEYGRKTWEIGPLGANGVRNARRFTYRDSDDKPTLVENGTVPDANSSTLTVINQTATVYDARRNPIQETVSAGGVAQSVVQRSFSNSNRLDCEAQRMNPAVFASLPASACTLGTQGSDGPDRITHNVYDNGSQLLQIQRAYGTALQQNYATYTYNMSGKQTSVRDANGNLATMTWDGHNRQTQWNFPSPTTPGVASATDYEAYTYDAAGNRLTLRRRDGLTLGFSYDNLNRLLVKTVPERAGLAATHTRDVYYGYDLRNAQLFARFDSAAPTSEGVTNVYDAYGRLTSSALLMDGVSRSVGSVYDPGSRRTQVIQPDGQYFTYAYDGASRLVGLYQGADTSVVLDTFTYNAQGLPATRAERYGSSVTYGFDNVARLTSQADILVGTGGNVSRTLGYNPASQITSRTRDNDAYAWTGGYNVSRSYSVNGLNQYTTAGPASFTYDLNGNLTSDGSRTFTYDEENRLVTTSNGVTLRYDPLGRLYEVTSASGTRRFVWDGDALVNQYNSAGTMTDRFVHGANAGADDPLVWYDGSHVNFLHADHQGSIVGVTNDTQGALLNAYDEWGIPVLDASGNNLNTGPFQYTGQLWLPELGMYHYKARIYSPTLGRFMQTDPVGYKDQVNLYEYAGDDPVNNVDADGQAVTAIYTPHNGSFLIFDNDTRRAYFTQAFTGWDRHELQATAPIPFGTYSILEFRGGARGAFYRLEGQDGVNDDRYEGRDSLRLHGLGHGYNLGCISVCTDEQMARVNNVITATRTTSTTVEVHSWDPRRGSYEQLRNYGQLRVLPNVNLNLNARTGEVTISATRIDSRIPFRGHVCTMTNDGHCR